MAIIDMKRGDSYIVRAYRGEELIFQRGNPYIERTDVYNAEDPAGSEDVYIHVDDVDLMYNWTYEAEVENLSQNPQSRIWCFMGGSFNRISRNAEDRIIGLFFGHKWNSYDPSKTTYETLASEALTNRGQRPDYLPSKNVLATIGTKHVISLKLDTIPEYHYGDNPYQATVNGFYLLAARNEVAWSYYSYSCDTGDAINFYTTAGSLYKNKGRVYRISLYDENNVLIHNYIPKIVDGHKGMLDTVINKFYACSDDTKFNIGLG